jgi:hypothetical protein
MSCLVRAHAGIENVAMPCIVHARAGIDNAVMPCIVHARAGIDNAVMSCILLHLVRTALRCCDAWSPRFSCSHSSARTTCRRLTSDLGLFVTGAHP